MREIFITALCIIFLGIISCSNRIMPQSYTIKYSIDNNFTKHQIDSVCNVENIPILDTNWIDNTLMKSYEKGTPIKQYIYILNDSITFIVTQEDSLYNMKKKTLNKIK